jgi:hypothetical protein
LNTIGPEALKNTWCTSKLIWVTEVQPFWTTFENEQNCYYQPKILEKNLNKDTLNMLSAVAVIDNLIVRAVFWYF